MNSIDQIINCSDNLSDEQVGTICSELTNPTEETKNVLTNILGIQIYALIDSPNFIKHMEWTEYIQDKNTINLTCIEDWKNPKKINLIKLLIVFNFVDLDSIKDIIEKESKKTYKNNEQIKDSSLSVKKMFDVNFKAFITNFYSKLDIIILQLVNLGINKDIIKNYSREMVEMMQSELICRNKYESGKLDEYTKKILDIIETRDIESNIYSLANKMYFCSLINEKGNEPLKFILNNTWDETKIKYKWLTELVTFINNENLDCKEYLINNYQIPNFNGIDYKTKCNLIKEVVNRFGLNKNSINSINKFIFSVGKYYKHGSYYKWYIKELERIKLFDNYKSKSFDENLLVLANKITPNTELEEIQQLIILVKEYYVYLANI